MWGTEQYDQLDDCSSLVYMCLMEARQKKVARMAGVVVVDRIFPPFFPLAQSPRFSKQSLLLNAGSVLGILSGKAFSSRGCNIYATSKLPTDLAFGAYLDCGGGVLF